MRFLFLNHNVVGSGTYFRAFHFGRQLAARGHQVTLVTTSRASRFQTQSYDRDGVEVIESPDWLTGRARTGWDPYNTIVRTALVKRRSYDVVHAFDSRPAVIHPALSAVRASNALFVMDWADWWGRGGWMTERSGPLFRATFGPIETWYEEAFRTRAHGMTVISRALGDRSRSLGIADERIECIPFGSARVVSADRSTSRKRLRVEDNARIVLHLGVLTPGDHSFLLKAFAHVPNATLVLAGRTGARIATSARTVVTGALDEETMHDWLAAANVCVVPARDTVGNRGRWPSKVNTYIEHGRAVVMPRVGDAAEFLLNTDGGFVTDANEESFGVGIAHALERTEECEAAGARAQAAAQRELNWTTLTDQLERFYDRVGALP
ncbi:MAG TPA: glycosyltransferase [Longimicrobiales bacterium]|nr:glycosyltransferase [Longimicrobiales bacterium]